MLGSLSIASLLSSEPTQSLLSTTSLPLPGPTLSLLTHPGEAPQQTTNSTDPNRIACKLLEKYLKLPKDSELEEDIESTTPDNFNTKNG